MKTVNHLPEYLIEAWAIAMFMLSACLFTVLLEHPASPVHQWVAHPEVRRGMIGLAMGLTAVGLIDSPWGRRSGAHMNPAVTLSFWRLGKITGLDAIFYILFQFIGAWAGVGVTALVFNSWMAHPAVHFAVTIPGPQGTAVAWLAEFGISFLLMGVILGTSGRPELASLTGIFAGILIALYVTFEAPLSGMSMNPARTLGSAFFAHVWDRIWIYFTAPPLGMLAAAEIYGPSITGFFCAKLLHDRRRPCIFCGQSG